MYTENSFIVDKFFNIYCFVFREKADFKHRLPKEQWWLKIRPLLRILAKHDSIYQTSAVPTDAETVDKGDNIIG